ncbi:serine/threonine protein kinase [Saccharopolyspora rhizosphaerae]|uniref:Serine/threonine protein kinase n=1 Tax=Saccharopolyspora rhizosphaerae TaxID=2492662 RepID=A0A3R8P249_9PSEU|nr:serine/threonine-protein kinase [Saccharopolyspora rhizosphaerae]RRO14781.1 serine/threonine protein kinase [Saccharopolyspora rhizosphaerae]
MQPLLASDPTTVGDYRLLARLGRGAMGGVYLGRSRGGRVVAVKVIRADLAEDPEFRERFRREADAARAVGGFWTAAVVNADPDAEQPWLATEYVPGPTLHQAVADHGALPEATVRSLGAGLAEALVAIHNAELVHRDLKPANVLLGPDGPRVIDFGISRAMTGQSLTATGIFLGTPGFFSPEQTLGDEVGPPSDVFSLGAVLVFAATGCGPFGEESTASMLYKVAHSDPDLSQVPDGLRDLLAECLDKDPAARPTPSQMLDRIGETSPQGSGWLPQTITAVIAQHATELQRTAQVPDTAPPQPVPASPQAPKKGGTQAYTQAPPVAAAAASSAPAPAPAPTPKPNPVSASASASAPQPIRDKIVPSPPHKRPTQSQEQRPDRVRTDGPGPEFRTRGRVSAAMWTVVFALLLAGAGYLAQEMGFRLFQGTVTEGRGVFRLGALLLLIGAVWSFCRVVAPSLRLKVNADGIAVHRFGFTRELPWHQVSRVGVAGRGKSTSLVVWMADGTVPRSALWHRVRSYHGGARIYPVGATGGWISRRQESRRLRSALEQYARGRYDSRML